MPIPRTESEFLEFLSNLCTKLPSYSTQLMVTAEELTSLKQDLAYLAYLVRDVVPTLRTSAQNATAHKQLIFDGPVGSPATVLPTAPTLPTAPKAVLPGVFERVSKLSQRIQKVAAFTDAMAADLQLLPAATQAVREDELVPAAPRTAALPGGQVRLEWIKGRLDGVRIEGRRGAEAEWVKLDDDRFSPYTDERKNLTAGQGELRQYRLRYLKKDQPVGQFSDTVTVQTLP